MILESIHGVRQTFKIFTKKQWEENSMIAGGSVICNGYYACSHTDGSHPSFESNNFRRTNRVAYYKNNGKYHRVTGAACYHHADAFLGETFQYCLHNNNYQKPKYLSIIL